MFVIMKLTMDGPMYWHRSSRQWKWNPADATGWIDAADAAREIKREQFEATAEKG